MHSWESQYPARAHESLYSARNIGRHFGWGGDDDKLGAIWRGADPGAGWETWKRVGGHVLSSVDQVNHRLGTGPLVEEFLLWVQCGCLDWDVRYDDDYEGLPGLVGFEIDGSARAMVGFLHPSPF